MNTVPAELLDKIIVGDNVAILRQLPDECIDLSVQSPPYDPVDENLNVLKSNRLRDYEGYDWNFKGIAAELYRVTKPGGVCVWVVGDATVNGSETGSSFRQALHFAGLGFNMETMIYQVAGTGAKGSPNYYWQAFEYMFVFSKGKPSTINKIADKINVSAGRRGGTSPKADAVGSRKKDGGLYVTQRYGTRTNVWTYHTGANGDDSTKHPAPFPEDLAKDHIITWSNEGDVVLDCFVGSGTTAKAAVLLDRHFVGIEISENYAKIARERIRPVQLQPKLIPFHLTAVL